MPVRLVLDTNVLVSGLITPGDRPPARLIDAVTKQAAVLVTSSAQVDEITDVLARDHLQRYLPPGVAEDFLATLGALADVTEGPLPAVDASPDPKDNFILATAVAGDADLLVTGDKRHLLWLEIFRGIPIVTAADAMQRLEEAAGDND